jgi:hypothetical protein
MGAPRGLLVPMYRGFDGLRGSIAEDRLGSTAAIPASLLPARKIGVAFNRELQAERAKIPWLHDFIDHHNHSPRPFAWIKNADDILASIEGFCTRTLAIHSAKNF